jgi:hypothetical protein
VPSLQRWKAPWSTGCWQPSRAVGRVWSLAGPSLASATGLFPCRRSGWRQRGVLWSSAGGERRQRTSSVRTRLGKRATPRLHARGHVLHSVQRPVHVNRHLYSACGRPKASSGRACRGRSGIAVGQTCESGRNRHRGLVGRTSRGSPRITALAREVARDASEKEGGRGHRPCEETRAPVSARTSILQLQKSISSTWPRIRSHAALPKEWR